MKGSEQENFIYITQQKLQNALQEEDKIREDGQEERGDYIYSYSYLACPRLFQDG